MSMGPNGQWVRARTDAGAKQFLAEKQMEAERRQESRDRSRAFWRRVVARLRRRFRRGGA